MRHFLEPDERDVAERYDAPSGLLHTVLIIAEHDKIEKKDLIYHLNTRLSNALNIL